MAWNTPTTWAAGAVLTAAQLNAQVRDNMLELGGAWSSYAPTLTNVTLGNGTLSGRRSQAGKLIHWGVTLVFGSTTTVSGIIIVSLPVATRSIRNRSPLGQAMLFDTSAPAYRLWTVSATATGSNTTAAINDANGALATNANPWTWAAGDEIEINGVYEAV